MDEHDRKTVELAAKATGRNDSTSLQTCNGRWFHVEWAYEICHLLSQWFPKWGAQQKKFGNHCLKQRKVSALQSLMEHDVDFSRPYGCTRPMLNK
ncbi:Hypothetical protein FKW44_001417 [Caligus rogercresseyi]|uniref:Uncharacterized protein n=1 Tax=Caligus rogercresseyi TaxID=217165 RepID=A0A7T8QVJ3_CALRO|nr:Hypothetical protein FKW44_001417 [Caligus rogercresseyi]